MKRAAALLRRLCRDDRGAVSILTAVLIVVLVGFTGLAVDTASIVYWRNRLQSATDIAALAAAFDTSRAAGIATTSLEANGPQGAVLQSTEIGTYVDDPSVSENSRFSAGASGNAVQLTAQYSVPLHFIGIFTGATTMPVRVTATAYNLPLAGIAVGTSAADADTIDTNSYLDAVTGTSLQLTDEERAALDATQISVFRLYDQIASRVGSRSMSIQSVMSSSVGLQTLAAAAAQAMTEQYTAPSADVTAAIDALTRISGQSDDSSPVAVSDVVTLDAHQDRAAQDMISTDNDSLGVPGLAILMDYLHAAQQDALVSLNETVTVPGLATVTVQAVVAKGTVGSGTGEAAVVGPVGSEAAGSRGRVQLTITLLQPLSINLGLVKVSLPVTVPLIADIGYGTATISDISCGPDIQNSTDVAVSAQAGAVHLYVGSVNQSQFTDLLTPLSPAAAQIINTSLVQVNAAGQQDIAQSGAQTLHFSQSDIDAGTVKSADGTSSIGDSLDQLASGLNVTVTTAPLGTGSLIGSVVKPAVSTVLSALEPELTQILASLGVRAGIIDVRATAARCGKPALVI